MIVCFVCGYCFTGAPPSLSSSKCPDCGVDFKECCSVADVCLRRAQYVNKLMEDWLWANHNKYDSGDVRVKKLVELTQRYVDTWS